MASHHELEDIHLKHDLLGQIEVGIVIVDRNFRVSLWNQFMENHSGYTPNYVQGRTLFELFGEVNQNWFRQKCDPVFELRSPAFIIWEQRPHLFRFPAYRPITSYAETMYQNVTIFPLTSLSGMVDRICIVVYDVTLEAVSKQRFEALNHQLEQMSRTDGLTGLYNRRYWEEMCDKEFKRVRRTGETASMIIMDIDHFKAINDTYGHPAGDQVIKTMAKVINTAIRETDISGRYGGEEFTIILPNTDAQNARFVAERIRKLAEAFPVQYEDKTITFTVSLGISMSSKSFDTHSNWIDKADKALYEAKTSGRNRTVMIEEAGTE